LCLHFSILNLLSDERHAPPKKRKDDDKEEEEEEDLNDANYDEANEFEIVVVCSFTSFSHCRFHLIFSSKATEDLFSPRTCTIRTMKRPI